MSDEWDCGRTCTDHACDEYCKRLQAMVHEVSAADREVVAGLTSWVEPNGGPVVFTYDAALAISQMEEAENEASRAQEISNVLQGYANTHEDRAVTFRRQATVIRERLIADGVDPTGGKP